jgi:hypothetical protein
MFVLDHSSVFDNNGSNTTTSQMRHFTLFVGIHVCSLAREGSGGARRAHSDNSGGHSM